MGGFNKKDNTFTVEEKSWDNYSYMGEIDHPMTFAAYMEQEKRTNHAVAKKLGIKVSDDGKSLIPGEYKLNMTFQQANEEVEKEKREEQRKPSTKKETPAKPTAAAAARSSVPITVDLITNFEFIRDTDADKKPIIINACEDAIVQLNKDELRLMDVFKIITALTAQLSIVYGRDIPIQFKPIYDLVSNGIFQAKLMKTDGRNELNQSEHKVKNNLLVSLRELKDKCQSTDAKKSSKPGF